MSDSTPPNDDASPPARFSKELADEKKRAAAKIVAEQYRKKPKPDDSSSDGDSDRGRDITDTLYRTKDINFDELSYEDICDLRKQLKCMSQQDRANIIRQSQEAIQRLQDLHHFSEESIRIVTRGAHNIRQISQMRDDFDFASLNGGNNTEELKKIFAFQDLMSTTNRLNIAERFEQQRERSRDRGRDFGR